MQTMRKSRSPKSTLALLFLTAGLLLVFKLAVVDRTKTPFRHPRLRDDGTLPGLAHPLGRSYADGMLLIGYEQSASQMPADGTLRVDLYWTVTQQPSRRYQSVIHLVGPEGFRWSPRDTFRPRGYQGAPPTTAWSPGLYALDSHEIEPLPGTPPGTYDIVLTIFDRETLAPLSVLNEQGQPAAPDLTLGQVTLNRPRHPAQAEACNIRNRLDASLGPLTLLGADFDRDEAAPGDPVLITTLWRADGAGEQGSRGVKGEDIVAHLALLASDGSTVAEYEFPPVASWYPTSAWQPGDVWRGQHLLHLPANLDTATYTWRLAVKPIHQSTNLPTSIAVTAPDRTFTPPSVDIDINTHLDNFATLVGASLDPITESTSFPVSQPTSFPISPSTNLTVTLVWRAEAETDISYRTFVHLIGPKMNLVAQSDAVPADWSRPTTGWLPGEYITDTHTLAIPDDAPAGDYVLQAGLYSPGGERLTTPDGADAISIIRLSLKAPDA